MAHRMTRAFAAVGLLGAGLDDCLVLTGWTPWGPLPQPNAFFTYNEEAEGTKEWAINCHASQVRLTDYTEFCRQLGRAYSALTREWSEGHRIAGGRAPRPEEHAAGVELFQIEAFDASRADLLASDPIQIALGLLAGKLSPSEAGNLVAV
jgi:LmbE family N-acetylglucosaminyl deacetylase